MNSINNKGTIKDHFRPRVTPAKQNEEENDNDDDEEEEANVDLAEDELFMIFTQRNCTQPCNNDEGANDDEDDDGENNNDNAASLKEHAWAPTDLTQCPLLCSQPQRPDDGSDDDVDDKKEEAVEKAENQKRFSRQVTLDGHFQPQQQSPTSTPDAKRHKLENPYTKKKAPAPASVFHNSASKPFKDTATKVFAQVRGKKDQKPFLKDLWPFRVGESYTSEVSAWKLCKTNTVPQAVENKAIYIIREFSVKNGKKYADCEVAIPFFCTLLDKTVQDEIEAVQPDFFVFLRNTEQIKLEVLHNLQLTPVIPSRPAIWEICSKKARTSAGWDACYKIREDKQLISDRRPRMLDLFAGCGGVSLAFEEMGFDIVAKVEKDHSAADTLRLNFEDSVRRVFCEDVRDFLRKCKLGAAGDPRYGMYPKPGDIDHIHASSPCNGFSDANISGGKNDKESNDLCFVIIDFIEFFKPLTASFENVTGMLRKENAAYLDRLISDTILKTGYQVRSGVLRASDFGDPQNRSRVILYFAKPGIQLPEFPKATHGAVTEDHPFAVPPGKTPQKPAVKGRQATQAAAMTPHQSMPLKPFRTVRDAIGYLEKIFPESGSGLVLVDGKLWTDHGIEGTYTKQGSDVLKADEAARTVRTTKGVRHYSLPRNLTVRELAELQSFPKDFQFCGSLTEKRKQIGNAVPIQFGKALAGAITYLCYPLAPCKQNA